MPNESENTRPTISNIRKMLSQAEKGGVQNTIQNCVTVLQNDPILADSIRLNLLSERIDIVKPMGWQRSGPTLTDTDMMYILRRMEKYGLYSEKRVSAAIRIVANENHYRPMSSLGQLFSQINLKKAQKNKPHKAFNRFCEPIEPCRAYLLLYSICLILPATACRLLLS